MTDAQPNHPDNGYNMDEVALCKSCGAMKHLNADGTCGRCAPNPPDLTVEERIEQVFSQAMTAYYDLFTNPPGVGKPYIDAKKAIQAEAVAKVERLVLEKAIRELRQLHDFYNERPDYPGNIFEERVKELYSQLDALNRQIEGMSNGAD